MKPNKLVLALVIVVALFLCTSPVHAVPLLSSTDAILGGKSDGTNFIVGPLAGNNWPGVESPQKAIDGFGQKYLNFGKTNTGFIVTPSAFSVADSIAFWTANDFEVRDPASYELWGTNADVSGVSSGASIPLSNFTRFLSGGLSLPSSRNDGGNSALDSANSQTISFSNSTIYESYLVLFPTVKNEGAANSMQVAEVEIYGTFPASNPGTAIPVGTGDENVIGSSSPEHNGRDEDLVVNGSGLITSGGKLIVNTGQPNGNNWNTTTETADITFDLGALYDLDFIQIWNFNDSFGNNDFGPQTIDLLVSNVGTNAQDADFGGSSVLATLSIEHATGSLSYFGENYRFNGKTAADIPTDLRGVQHDFSSTSVRGRFVRFANLDGSNSYGGRTGLSEVRFYGELVAAVPEPTTLALMGLGLAGIGYRRHRSKIAA